MLKLLVYGHWTVSDDLSDNRGWMYNVNEGLQNVPSSGWQYDDNGWHSDKTLHFDMTLDNLQYNR